MRKYKRLIAIFLLSILLVSNLAISAKKVKGADIAFSVAGSAVASVFGGMMENAQRSFIKNLSFSSGLTFDMKGDSISEKVSNYKNDLTLIFKSFMKWLGTDESGSFSSWTLASKFIKRLIPQEMPISNAIESIQKLASKDISQSNASNNITSGSPIIDDSLNKEYSRIFYNNGVLDLWHNYLLNYKEDVKTWRNSISSSSGIALPNVIKNTLNNNIIFDINGSLENYSGSKNFLNLYRLHYRNQYFIGCNGASSVTQYFDREVPFSFNERVVTNYSEDTINSLYLPTGKNVYVYEIEVDSLLSLNLFSGTCTKKELFSFDSVVPEFTVPEYLKVFNDIDSLPINEDEIGDSSLKEFINVKKLTKVGDNVITERSAPVVDVTDAEVEAWDNYKNGLITLDDLIDILGRINGVAVLNPTDVLPSDEITSTVVVPDVAIPIGGDVTKDEDGTIPAIGDFAGTVSEEISQTNVNIIDIFPFCIPWDLKNAISLLSAPAETPRFEIPFKFEKLNIDYTFIVDFAEVELLARITRVFSLLFFIVGLIILTRNIIRG